MGQMRSIFPKKQFWQLVGMAILSLLGLGCGQELAPSIRIAVCIWPSFDFVRLARDHKFFESEGVDVQVVEYASLNDMRRAYERGQVDGMTCTLSEILLSRERSPRHPQVFFVTDYSNGADCLLVQPSIHELPSLRGKQIGIEPGTFAPVMVYHALKAGGLKLSDVTLVPLSREDIDKRFISGELAAIQTYTPFSTKLLARASAHTLFDSAHIPGAVLDVLVLDRLVLDHRSTDATRIIRAFLRARAYFEERPEEALREMAALEGISSAQMSDSLRGLKFVPLAHQQPFFVSGGELERQLDATADALRQTGWLKGVYPPAEFISATTVRQVLGP